MRLFVQFNSREVKVVVLNYKPGIILEGLLLPFCGS